MSKIITWTSLQLSVGISKDHQKFKMTWISVLRIFIEIVLHVLVEDPEIYYTRDCTQEKLRSDNNRINEQHFSNSDDDFETPKKKIKQPKIDSVQDLLKTFQKESSDTEDEMVDPPSPIFKKDIVFASTSKFRLQSN